MGFLLSPAHGTTQPVVIAPALDSRREQFFLIMIISYAFPVVKTNAVPQPTNAKKAPAPAATAPAPPPVDSSEDSSEESDSEEEVVPPSQVRSH